MNFATLSYAIFLAVVVLVYWLIPRRAGRYWLIVASLVFYGSWNPIYVPGFVVLLLANWWLGLAAAGPHRSLAVGAAVAIDLGVLGVFKYADWLLGSSASVFARLLGQPVRFGALELILPLAISFVTFTMLAYVIDIKRGTSPPERDLGRFALFVVFFPHLISGPIMRAREFLPQVRHPRPFAIEHVRAALPLLVSGLLKKTLGDLLAPTVELTFGHPADYSTIALWVGVLAFAFQILLDFSGYTDLALGSARLMGFQLPRNFDWPYRAGSIQEFWRRWHMTLSRWLRDYLYISLGGSRHGEARTYAAALTTMLLGGLWHGAGVTFIAWGAWHGAGQSVHRWYRTHIATRWPMPGLAGWALTFGFVLVSWVLFRAGSMSNALAYLRGMFVPHGGQLGGTTMALVGILCLAFVAGQWPGFGDLARRLIPAGTYRRYLAYGLALVAAVALIPVSTTAFIYFQF